MNRRSARNWTICPACGRAAWAPDRRCHQCGRLLTAAAQALDASTDDATWRLAAIPRWRHLATVAAGIVVSLVLVPPAVHATAAHPPNSATLVVGCLLGFVFGLLFASPAMGSWPVAAAAVAAVADRHDDWGMLGTIIVATFIAVMALLPTTAGTLGLLLRASLSRRSDPDGVQATRTEPRGTSKRDPGRSPRRDRDDIVAQGPDA